MGSFDFAVKLRRAGLDVGVANALILDMPVEPGLEFVAVVGADFANPKWEFGDDIVDERDRVGLGADRRFAVL